MASNNANNSFFSRQNWADTDNKFGPIETDSGQTATFGNIQPPNNNGNSFNFVEEPNKIQNNKTSFFSENNQNYFAPSAPVANPQAGFFANFNQQKPPISNGNETFGFNQAGQNPHQNNNRFSGMSSLAMTSSELAKNPFISKPIGSTPDANPNSQATSNFFSAAPPSGNMFAGSSANIFGASTPNNRGGSNKITYPHGKRINDVANNR